MVRYGLYKVLLVFVIVLLLLQYSLDVVFVAQQLEAPLSIDRLSSAGHRRSFFSSTTNGSVFPDETDVPDVITGVQMTNRTIPLCPPVSPKLVGPFGVLRYAPPLAEVDKKFPVLEPGGHYRPPDCRARDKVAIIVPYRNRERHLAVFLLNLHPLLQRQQLDYQIFVVEQAGNRPFNRAMLMNVGFAEAIKLYDFDCFIFHDVDLLPEDDRNLYTCPEQPRHMSVAIDVNRYKLLYASSFGGVSAMTRAQFEKVNGFSNVYWGWGSEDDDMFNRAKFHGYNISRYPSYIGRYIMLRHRKQKINAERRKLQSSGPKRFKSDGINSLQYELKELKLFHTYTLLLVELPWPSIR